MLHFWNQELLVSTPISFLVSTFLVGLFIRELRKPNGLDDELKRDLIHPGVFIPIVEQAGLIGTMTEWLLAYAIQDQDILRQRFPDLYASINLSPTRLKTGNVSHLIQILNTNSAARALITF